MVRVTQLALLGRIADERGLDQDRRHVGRAQHHEVGALDVAAMGRADFCQRLEHVAGDHVAGLDRPALLQVQHHLGQAVVHAIQGGATDQVGVFAVGQHPRRLIGLAAR